MASLEVASEAGSGDSAYLHTWSLALILFSLLLSVYFFSYSGLFTSDDEQHLAAGAQTFALTGQFGALPLYGNPRLQGNFYNVDPGLPFLGSLIYQWVALTSFGTVQAFYLLNPFVTALSAVFVFLIGQQSGYAPSLSLAAALLYGLGSMAWPYAGTFFRDPLASLFVIIAWYFYESALSPARSPRARLTLGGLALASLLGGILSKNIVIPLVPVLAFVALLRLGWGRAQWAGVAALLLLGLIFFLRPVGSSQFRSSAAYFVWLQQWLTAIPHNSFWAAFWGALLSPGKGLVFFAPFAFLVPFGWLVAWRTHWPRLLAPSLWLLILVAAQAFFYDYRWTNPQWGARFLLPALPALAVAALPALHWFHARAPRAAWAVFAAFLGLGLFSQLPGVLIAPPAYTAILLKTQPNVIYNLAVWDPYYSAILGHWRLLLSGTPWALALVRNFAVNRLGVIIVVTGLSLGAGLALYFLRLGPGRWRLGPAVLALGLSLLAPISMLSAYQQDPAYSGNRLEYTEAVNALNEFPGPNDLVAIRGYLSPLWYAYFNFGRPLRPWVGLPLFSAAANDAPPGDPFYLPPLDAALADQTLLGNAGQTNQHLWFADDGSTPVGAEGLDVEAWLQGRYHLEQRLTTSTARPLQILEFSLSPN